VLDVSDLSVEETAMRVIKLVADRQREHTQKHQQKRKPL
jgi:regulator of PEP synthase PpsR (kinase-PPPase family)